MIMNTVAHTPDAPFRSGTTGKYKLIIRSVTPKFRGYEYNLEDADGKVYKAVSMLHYAPNQLLRCMVHFEVADASLVVTNTLVCKKQDFATAIPEEQKPKPKPKPISKAQEDSKPKAKPKSFREPGFKKTLNPKAQVKRNLLGDPNKTKMSGVYNLLVVEVEKTENFYLYVLEDVVGHKYSAQSKKYFDVGRIIGCMVSIVKTEEGKKMKVTSMGKHSKSHKIHYGHSGKHSSDWLPAPPVGTYFHLIYTPMGNKR